mmetsp:Transcript_7848/g.12770  ORF Transcript_7848/g.12770 Transcript_7848/m.12770 type:complete len:124 (-) Transcript_7848:191-562(-)
MMFPNKRLRTVQSLAIVQSGHLDVARSERMNSEQNLEQKMRSNGRDHENAAMWNKRRCTRVSDALCSSSSSSAIANQNNPSSEKTSIEDLALPHGLKPPMLTRKRTDPYLGDMRNRAIYSVEF